MKQEVDAIERIKEEEMKKFQAHKLYFDPNVIVKVKESMVDLSSSCIELALKVLKISKLDRCILHLSYMARQPQSWS